MAKCQLCEGITIKPDGVNELVPCFYVETEIHVNATVHVSTCKHCGHTIVEWERQDNTESYYTENLEEDI